ncbi:MAG: hypothetical protein Q9209_002503 [Squamulea sp. 1 TL-2023]
MKQENAAQPGEGPCEKNVRIRVGPNPAKSKAVTFHCCGTWQNAEGGYSSGTKESGENHTSPNDAADAYQRQAEDGKKRRERIRAQEQRWWQRKLDSRKAPGVFDGIVQGDYTAAGFPGFKANMSTIKLGHGYAYQTNGVRELG